MWRALARRVLLWRATRPQELAPSLLLRHQGSVTLPSAESATRIPIFSRNSDVFHSFRFFSSNRAESYDEASSGFPLSEGNEIDGNENTELESWESAFDNVEENLVGSVDVSGAATGESLESDVIVDERTGVEMENDPEKVENLLSSLQSRGTARDSLEADFERMDLVVDENLVLRVLNTPYIAGENLISFFRWVMKKPGYELTASMVDALISAICVENRKMQVYALWDLIKEIGEKAAGLVSTKMLNELISELSRLGKGKAAFEVFNKFEEFGCHRNADTYYLTIEALCKRSFYDWACSVCEKMLSAGDLPDAEKVGNIISYFCRGGRSKDAHMVYVYAKDKNISPPPSTVTFLIRSLGRIEKCGEGDDKERNKELNKETVSLALEMLNDYSVEDRMYAIKPFSSVIKKLCWIEDVDRAKKLLHEMIESGPPPGNDVFNFVINGLAKSGDVVEAMNLKTLMQKRGLKPDVYTYSVIISGYVRVAEMGEACKIFKEAKRSHSKLSRVTFHSLIRGFCKLEQFDKAVNLLKQMKAYGVSPLHDEYNKLIKSLCMKATDWKTAEMLEEQMEKDGLILNGRTKALIKAVKELDQETTVETSSHS
ncbi:pentatricopeptide repeat-containing protein At3g02650, mitochondrial-like [Andrographis paniculata]|uniref:pentatricopeptide repeat-containing protein At3g02650, mitochondrial-like n=1 Tax=Andrographis paniculata TaxID=175694 RepID=UPI0021E74A11|nr:pentatricopeptide repeat-containing protein At3g02650, mitochondrial-like [Andrographis paniculata]